MPWFPPIRWPAWLRRFRRGRGRGRHRLARVRRKRRRARGRVRRLRPRGATRRPGARAGDEGQAGVRGGCGGDRPRPERAAGRGAVPPLRDREVRRLPLPGPRLRGPDRGEGAAGARRARSHRPHRGRAGRADRPGGVALPLPQQARILVLGRGRGRGRARLPSRRPLGPGDRHRGVPAHHRPRKRDPPGGAGLGPRGEARALRPGDRRGLPAAPRLPRGAEHGPGARRPRHRAGREVRDRLPRRRPPPLPRGPLDPLGDQRHACGADEPPDPPALGRGRDRGEDARAPLPRAPERVPADEHGDGGAAVRDRAASSPRSPGRRTSTTSTAAPARSGSRSRATRATSGVSRSRRKPSRARSRTPS